ncbi:MAG TPA: DNA polymerase III subunit gamma/tau, partial [Anaerohalosphaeraceae bacterium]|nr:DNA polymerase III subunit gamma/tau [Anaerohalosphaeraceae bacterium]
MAYTVLARRYRSQTFDDVVGQEAVAQTLKNAILSGRVAHAYLFTGTRGVGKTTMARILAKSLNCLKSKEPTVHPCLECDSCRSIHTGDDIDVIEIDGASNNKVEHVRELIANAIYRPARARFKIYIIDEVHMLTSNAFNALLKILEEPPDYVKFIFATTEPNKVLPTIQSRCQRFDFAAMNAQTITAQLRKILQQEQVEYEEDLLVHLARLANGSMRDALSLLDQLLSVGQRPLTAAMLMECMGRPDRRHLLKLAEQIASRSAPGVLAETARLMEMGQMPVTICDALIEL